AYRTGQSQSVEQKGGETPATAGSSKRYLAKKEEVTATTAEETSPTTGARKAAGEAAASSTGEILKKAVNAPEFRPSEQPSVAASSSTAPTQHPSTRPPPPYNKRKYTPAPSAHPTHQPNIPSHHQNRKPQHHTTSAPPPHRQHHTQPQQPAHQQQASSQQQQVPPATAGIQQQQQQMQAVTYHHQGVVPVGTSGVVAGATMAPSISVQPMMTSSGHIVLMTENGLMVPADGFANYMYGYTYPMYMPSTTEPLVTSTAPPVTTPLNYGALPFYPTAPTAAPNGTVYYPATYPAATAADVTATMAQPYYYAAPAQVPMAPVATIPVSGSVPVEIRPPPTTMTTQGGKGVVKKGSTEVRIRRPDEPRGVAVAAEKEG
ncbi:hypothetical protein HK102_011398, partial [Quaeritorhiza haematococci]